MALPSIHILDTGICPAVLETLARRTIIVKAGNDWTDSSPFPLDETGHGTGIASIVYNECSELLNSIERLEIVIHKVERENLYDKQQVWARAITGIARQAKRNTTILLPLGSWSAHEDVRNALIFCQESDVVFVTTAHNDGLPTSRYPGRLSNELNSVLSIGALDKQGKLLNWPFLKKGSNFGREVSIYALGEDVPIIDKNARPSLASGTSVSSARVAALIGVARLRSNHLTNIDTCSILLKESDIDVQLPDGSMGRRLNADAFLNSLARTSK